MYYTSFVVRMELPRTGVLGFEVRMIETGNGSFQARIWKRLLFCIKLEQFQSLCEQWTPF